MKSKYTFEALMNMNDDELNALSKKLNNINNINYLLNNINPKPTKKFKISHWDIADICRHASIIVGCYFIGKGLSEFGNREVRK